MSIIVLTLLAAPIHALRMIRNAFLALLALALPVFGGGLKIEELGEQISGKDQMTQADIDGKLVVAHLWEAHCGACKTAVPAFQKEIRSGGKQVVPLILHRNDKVELAKETAKGMRLKLPVFHGSEDVRFKAKTWPCVIIVKPDGEVLYNGSPGEAYEKALRAAKKELR